ncbi:histidine kinase N-terminal 7TM domain-containing protein [Pedobacter sp. AW31-3R]|uniref:sensor histidine kinase n=1 Tax=Pedobacter sp. AW31-3R TaxID=3445781 RepID=UPI003F9FB0DE
MNFVFNIYALSLVFFGSIAMLLSFYILKNEKGSVRWVGFMMLSTAIWSLAYGAELASTQLPQMKLFVILQYAGISALPVAWFRFCLDVVEKRDWFQKLNHKLLIIAVPVVTFLLVCTNDLHHIYYKNLSVDDGGVFPMLAITPALTFHVFTVYFYVIYAIGSYLLIIKFKNSDATYRRQNYIILIAAFIPWIANFCYKIGLKPLDHLDLTPFAFLLTTTLVFIAIYRFKLFDILPVARKKILELMQDGFIVLDYHHRIIDFNSAFIKYNAHVFSDKIIGKKLDEVFPDQPVLLQLVEKHYSGKHILFVRTKDGLCELEADIRLISPKLPNRSATIIKLQDLTDLKKEAVKSKQQADELQKLNALKDRIFSIMAHDLRGPLLNISEVLKMINSNMITLDEFKALSPTLTKDIAYTTDLLENILHWSRSQLNGYSINKEIFDLKTLITNEVNYHLPAAVLKKIEVVQDIPTHLPAFADMLMMQIVIRNLITNAIKFCSEGCRIDIFIHGVTKDYVDICIKDNGVGIADEMVRRLFKGEHISSRGTQNEKGTGLGLMVCRDFMERNHGNIQVESRVGAGTKFCLKIPSREIEEAPLTGGSSK